MNAHEFADSIYIAVKLMDHGYSKRRVKEDHFSDSNNPYDKYEFWSENSINDNLFVLNVYDENNFTARFNDYRNQKFVKVDTCKDGIEHAVEEVAQWVSWL